MGQNKKHKHMYMKKELNIVKFFRELSCKKTIIIIAVGLKFDLVILYSMELHVQYMLIVGLYFFVIPHDSHSELSIFMYT